MEILMTSIRIIDYSSNSVYTRETPPAFNEYVNDLISHINENTSVRDFKTKSPDTEVISCVKQIVLHRGDNDLVQSKIDIIANRLLEKEIEAQSRVEHLNINVQKGSLVQALLYDRTNDLYTYLFAKVEHGNFVDDSDFSFKTGFSKDKKTMWKSCLIEIPTTTALEYYAKIYSNTLAKYWSSDFLELTEMISDETNTTKAFKSIDSVLKHQIRKNAPRDYVIVRNSIISYFKNKAHFDYDQMLNSVLGEYQPVELSTEKLNDIRAKLQGLPEEKKFDKQFTPISSVINAKIKQIYEVNTGIEIRITDEVPDINNVITAVREDDGYDYIKIRTNNSKTFNFFRT